MLSAEDIISVFREKPAEQRLASPDCVAEKSYNFSPLSNLYVWDKELQNNTRDMIVLALLNFSMGFF